tara:strand:+ start:504 stop:1439 length:936 start_codon:yes stop_codon:yes gene_type:complete
MSGMNMSRFAERHSSISANSGAEFGEINRVVVQNGLLVRLVGDFASVWEHFVSLDGSFRPYYCEGPDSDCPLCTAANELSFSDDKDQQDTGRNIRAKERFYFNALDRSPAGKAWHEQNGKTKLLTQSEKSSSIGSMLFKAIGDVVRMRQQQGQDPDPNGFDLLLQKTGTGVKTKYGAQFTGDVSPLTEQELSYEQYTLDTIARVTPRSERENAAAAVLGKPASPAQPVEPMPPPAPPSPPPAPAPAKAPAKLDIKPKSEYQSTAPRPDADLATTMVVPCSSCNVDMQFSMEDMRDLECHGCKQVYTHPAKG